MVAGGWWLVGTADALRADHRSLKIDGSGDGDNPQVLRLRLALAPTFAQPSARGGADTSAPPLRHFPSCLSLSQRYKDDICLIFMDWFANSRSLRCALRTRTPERQSRALRGPRRSGRDDNKKAEAGTRRGRCFTLCRYSTCCGLWACEAVSSGSPLWGPERQPAPASRNSPRPSVLRDIRVSTLPIILLPESWPCTCGFRAGTNG